MAELKPYQPSLRDRLAQMLMGDSKPSPHRRQVVERLTGSTGLGTNGIGLADLLPIFAIDDAARDSDPERTAQLQRALMGR